MLFSTHFNNCNKSYMHKRGKLYRLEGGKPYRHEREKDNE